VTEAQLERLCSVAEELREDGSVPAKKKAKELASRVAKDQLGPAAEALIRAAMEAPPKLRYEIVTRATKRLELTRYECPALEEILTK
jgi:hypothetical protein